MNFLEADVAIKVDDKQLPAQLAKARSAVTRTVTKIRASFARMASSFKAAFNKMVRIAKYAMVGIVAALALVTRAAMKQEDVLERLNIVLKSTGYAAGLSRKELVAHAQALQKVTVYGDETIEAMQALLLTFKSIRGEVFMRTTEAILDLSKAMGQDLQQSVIQIGKAINDPILGMTALRRVGIQFTADQEKMIRTLMESGRLFEAQGIILTELESQFGGMSRNVDTARGMLSQMWNALGDVAEVIGSTLLPAVKSVSTAIKEWAIKDQEKIAVGFVKAIQAMVEAVRFLVKEISILPIYWKEAEIIITKVAIAIWKVADAATNLDEVFAWMRSDTETYKNIIKDLETNISKLEAEVEKLAEAYVKGEPLVDAFFDSIIKNLERVEKIEEESTRTLKEWAIEAYKKRIALIDEELTKIKEASDLVQKLAEQDKQAIIEAAKEQVAFIREQDYMTRQERIINLKAYVEANQEALDLVLEAYKIIMDELGRLEEVKMAGTRRWLADAGDLWLQLDKVAVAALDSVTDALTNMVMKGKADFKALALSIITDLTRMMIKQMMFNALVGGAGGGGGFGAVMAGLFGIGSGSVASGGATNAQAVAAFAPSLQYGGEVDRTGLAIVHKKETFSGVNNEMGFGNTIVNITDFVGVDIEVDEYRDSDQRIIDVTLKAAAGDGTYRRSHNLGN